LPEWLRVADNYYLIVYALLVMGLLIYSPSGLIGIVDRYLVGRRTRAASAARAAIGASIEDLVK